MSTGVIFKIYKLDRLKIEGLTDNLLEVPTILVKKYNEEKKKILYEKIPQTQQPKNEYELTFYKKSNVTRIQHKWKTFFEKSRFTLGDPGTELHHLACFIYQKSTKDFYVISTGHAYVLFEQYVDYVFPIEIGRRIAKPEIKSAETKAISGYLLARNLFFRTPRRISLVEGLDSVWTKLFSTLRDDILLMPEFIEIFGKKNKVSLAIKTSIDINCSLTEFDKLMGLITWLGKISATTAPIDNNLEFMDTIRPLDPRKAKIDIQKLENELLNQLSSVPENYDLCHEEHSRYINAEHYVLSIGQKEVLEMDISPTTLDVLDALRKNNDDINIEALKKYKLSSEFSEEAYLNIENSLYHHLCGEVIVGNNNYFLLNGRWFFVSNNFINLINDDFEKIAKDNNIKSIIDLNNWPKDLKKEQDYNISYQGQHNFLVGDKILVQNTELFDLLQWNNDIVRVVHVKKGFNVKVRDLSSQISNAAHIIENDIRASKKTILKEVYKKLKDNNRLNGMTEEQFLELFNRNREYVFAYAEKEDVLLNPKNIGSNIAKYELVNLQNEMLRYSGNKSVLKLKWIKYDS